MPKYLGNEEVNPTPAPKQAPEKNDLDKINDLVTKGISLFDKIMSLKKYRQEQAPANNNQMESKANKIAQQTIANQPKPSVKVDVKTHEAVEDLIKQLEKLDDGIKSQTLNDLVETYLPELKKSGMLHVAIESFLKKYVEVNLL